MFDDKSRYAKLTPYAAVDRRGRTVAVVPSPDRPVQSELGIHAHKQGERADHLAARYLRDETGFWRVAEHNDVMLPETLTEALEIAIPAKK
jgi:hypothetical protein